MKGLVLMLEIDAEDGYRPMQPWAFRGRPKCRDYRSESNANV